MFLVEAKLYATDIKCSPAKRQATLLYKPDGPSNTCLAVSEIMMPLARLFHIHTVLH
jgi:hypothetical protein